MWGWEKAPTLTSWLCAQHPKLPSRPEPQLGLLDSAKTWWGSEEKLVPVPQWAAPACTAPSAGSNLENLSRLASRQALPRPTYLHSSRPQDCACLLPCSLPVYPDPGLPAPTRELDYSEPVGPRWGLLCSP